MQASTIFPTSPNFPRHFPPKAPRSPREASLLVSGPGRMSSLSGLVRGVSPVSAGSAAAEVDGGFPTLMEYVGGSGAGVPDDLVILVILVSHLQYAAKRIAALVASPLNSVIVGWKNAVGGAASGERDAPKPLDIVSSLCGSWMMDELESYGEVQ